MNVALRRTWTQDQFFAWADLQEGRYEFDGSRPVAMTGGSVRHSRIIRNLHRALDARLRGRPCEPLGPEAGMITMGKAVRYPDALVTCEKQAADAMTVSGAVIVFEVLSPSSGYTDRIVKPREYAAVGSIRRYVILEYSNAGLTNYERIGLDQPWITTTLTADDALRMPEIGVEVPVAEFYEDIEFAVPDPGD